jgi:hypothetical protein
VTAHGFELYSVDNENEEDASEDKDSEENAAFTEEGEFLTLERYDALRESADITFYDVIINFPKRLFL